MHDARFDRLAKLLVEYSIRLKRNETVLIEAFDIPDEMTIALIRAVRKAGGVPFVQTYYTRVNRALALEASDRQLNLMASHELARMKKMNAYMAVRGSNNVTELSDVPPEKMKLIGRKRHPVQDQRVKKTKWVVVRWPTPSTAQLAGMSTEAFEDVYFDAFSLGFYPRVFQLMRDILFDEKIAGSFHLTPGQAYEEADNGNRSQVHWDMVSIQRPDYGGGEIYFDGKLIRKDGKFLSKQLQSLNWK